MTDKDKKIKYNSVVTQIFQVSPTMRIIRVKPDEWEMPPFKPGQFVVLGLYGDEPRIPDAGPEHKPADPDKMIRRAYSIASSSRDDFIEFYISLVKSGQLTPRLFNLNVGDRLFMSQKPTGMFTLDQVPEDQNLILFATGTGIAPYMSMLRTDALSRQGKIVVVHGADNSWDLGYHGELRMLERLFPNKLMYYPTITRPEKEPVPWEGDTRFFEDIWKDPGFARKIGFEPRPENTHIFLCGNPNMITSMKEVLKADGFKEHTKREPGQIHAEEF